MCGLCGTLGGEDHWTVGSNNTSIDPSYRRRERYRRIALANRILGLYHLKLNDFQGFSYILCNATGKQEIVSDLGGLWMAAEEISNTLLDPLDHNFLKKLAQKA